jgi:predicted nucleic acid-binding Zn ribbon protein
VLGGIRNDEPMTDWKKFALLLFVIGALAAVVVVYMAIQGELARII